MLNEEYVKLLELLYKDQHGNVDSHRFQILRGVRQGDVLSPLLFNAVIEHAMEKWKKRLSSEGFALQADDLVERLTNIRYADDILLFAKDLDECQFMLESLVEVLREYGLELNMQKTKILSTHFAPLDQTFLITNQGSVEILATRSKHKYLGRGFIGDLRQRGVAAVEHRLSCGWISW